MFTEISVRVLESAHCIPIDKACEQEEYRAIKN